MKSHLGLCLLCSLLCLIQGWPAVFMPSVGRDSHAHANLRKSSFMCVEFSQELFTVVKTHKNTIFDLFVAWGLVRSGHLAAGRMHEGLFFPLDHSNLVAAGLLCVYLLLFKDVFQSIVQPHTSHPEQWRHKSVQFSAHHSSSHKFTCANHKQRQEKLQSKCWEHHPEPGNSFVVDLTEMQRC